MQNEQSAGPSAGAQAHASKPEELTVQCNIISDVIAPKIISDTQLLKVLSFLTLFPRLDHRMFYCAHSSHHGNARDSVVSTLYEHYATTLYQQT